MREKVWLRLRSSQWLRRLSELPAIGAAMKSASLLLVPSHSIRFCEVRGGAGAGLIMELNPRWQLSTWEGRYEQAMQQVLAEHLGPGKVFYDIGAGIGFYSCLAARLGATVYAFEPDAQNADLVEKHAELNKLSGNLKVVRMAASSKSGPVNLRPPAASRLTSHANSVVVEEACEDTIQIESVRLDEFANEYPRPTLCKLDVEGHESEVLKGSDSVFRSVRPLVLCELHDAQNESFVGSWLVERGYQLTWLETGDSFPKHLYAAPK